MAAAAKHLEISRHLRAEIAAGRYAAGARLPSEAQLVKQFSVSRPTVARALQDLVRENIIERRAGSGSFLRSSASLTDTRQLGFLVPNCAGAHISELISTELASLARARDFSVLRNEPPRSIRPHEESLARDADEFCGLLIERRVSGVFIAPARLHSEDDSVHQHRAQSLRAAGIPLILLGSDIQPFPSRSDFDLVAMDNVAAGYLLAEHFIKLGCRRLYFVALPHPESAVSARISGVREALVRLGGEMEPNWVRFGNPADLKFVRGLVAGRQADAFVCGDDYIAALLSRSIERIGFEVPRDARLAGFDDGKYATLAVQHLTTIQQPCRDLALVAFRSMLERIAEPTLPARTLLLAPRLVVRDSCGAYPRPMSSAYHPMCHTEIAVLGAK